MSLMGVDLGIHKVAMALYDEGELVNALSWESPADIRDAQLQEVAALVHDQAYVHDVDSIWIEDVLIGNNKKYSMSLAETKGAVMCYCAPLRYQQGLDIRLVNVNTWKKQVCGYGHASKEQVRNYIIESHPSYAPLCEGDQDLYDAACVGLYGLQITERAEHLHL